MSRHIFRNFRRRSLPVLVLSLAAATSASAAQYSFRVPLPGFVAQESSHLGALSFSSCGVSGRFGPTLAQCKATYSNQPLILASLAMPGFPGYQEWTVPKTGNYTIAAAGAGGGQAPNVARAAGGRGAIVQGTFHLAQGTVLQIVVGQPGVNAQSVPYGVTDAGGAGGTFVVVKASNSPLVVAGGGGGGNNYTYGSIVAYGSGGDGAMGSNTVNPTNGSPYPGSTTYNFAEPGAGFATNGAYPGWGSGGFVVAQGFSNGAVGGISTNATANGPAGSINRYGGFGGGAGSHGWYCIGGGAGGGYTGGVGAIQCAGGGGGSSYISSSSTGSASSTGLFNGVSLGTSALGWVPASTAGYVTISQ